MSSRLRKLLGEAPLSKFSVQEGTCQILTETDPVRRSVALGLILDSMTPETALSIRQAFIDSTVSSGRRNDHEWTLMVRKVGETLGLAGYEAVKGNGLEESLALEGWAMVDADGAFAHLQTMDKGSREYADNCAALLAGIAKIDPDKCFQLVLDHPDLSVNPQTLIKSAVQSLGMDGATQALQKALDEASPEAAQGGACQSMFFVLADDMMHQNWASGQSEKVLPWLEQLKRQPFVTDQVASHAAMDVALQGKIAESINWLDRMNDGDVGGAFGRNGLRSALMRNPSLLTKVDDATLDRVIAQFPPNSPLLSNLAEVIAPLKPDYASRLRAAGP